MKSIAPRGSVHIGKMFQAQNSDRAVGAKSRFIALPLRFARLASSDRPRPATLGLGHRVDLHLTEFQRSARSQRLKQHSVFGVMA
jgi:hypothetical protein